MSSGKKRVKQPVAVAGGAKPTISKTGAMAVAVIPSAPTSASTSASSSPAVRAANPPPPRAQHPPVLVASTPIVSAPSKALMLDDFPPLPSGGSSSSKSSQPSTPPTPKQFSPSAPPPVSAGSAGSASQPRVLSNVAAEMMEKNAQSRVSKAQQLRDTLRKVQAQGREEDAAAAAGRVTLQGEEARQRAAAAPLSVLTAAPNPPASPIDGNSPLDLSTYGAGGRQQQSQQAGSAGKALEPSTSFSAAYSPIPRRSGQRRDGGLEDSADLSVDDVPASRPSAARSLTNARNAASGTFASSSAVQSGGLSDEELAALLAVADDPNNSSGSVSKAAYVTVCRHLVRLQSVMSEREADLRMAGELGEAICAENGKLEAIVEELTHSLDAQMSENGRMEEARQQLQQTVDELRRNNRRLTADNSELAEAAVDAQAETADERQRAKAGEDSASAALSEFIRSELSGSLLNSSLDASFDSGAASPVSSQPSAASASSTSKAIKYTGNVILDLTNLQRKLRRERRMWDRQLQTMEQSLQQKERERAELKQEVQKLESEAADIRLLQGQMLAKSGEWEEKEEALKQREEKLQHELKLRLASTRRQLEQELAAKEEELQKESRRRQELETSVTVLNARIAELSHEVELWSVEKAREQSAKQALEKVKGAEERKAMETEQRRTVEERRRMEEEQKVRALEQSRLLEEKRAQQLESRMAEQEKRLAEEEKRRQALETELRHAKLALQQAKEQQQKEQQQHQRDIANAVASVVTTSTADRLASQPAVITAEASAALATPRSAAAPKADSRSLTLVAEASSLSPTAASSSSAAVPLWVLPHPTMAVSAKEQALLSAVFSFLSHQWTMALLLLVASTSKKAKKSVEWIKDAQSSECLSCHQRFNLLLRRRHHCRLCGGLYCNDCSNATVDLSSFGLQTAESGPQRVCSSCFSIFGVLTHGESLIVHRTKVQQKLRSTEGRLKKAKKAAAPQSAAEDSRAAPLPLPAPSAAAASTASAPSLSAADAKVSRPVSAPTAIVPVSGPAVISATPRVKKAKSSAQSAAPIPLPAPSPAASSGVVISSPAMQQPAVAAAQPAARAGGSGGAVVTGVVSSPVSRLVVAAAPAGGDSAAEAQQPPKPATEVKKKKLVKKVVKKAAPVALTQH